MTPSLNVGYFVTLKLTQSDYLAWRKQDENRIIYSVIRRPQRPLSFNFNPNFASTHDKMYNAKLSDFGLAKLGPSDENSHVTTRVMGTLGYAAPEYVATGHLYVKSDVYGFGVVLLELLTGLRAVDVNRPSGQMNLVEWARPRLSSKTKLRTIMDVKMEGQYEFKAAIVAAQLTLQCLRAEPKSRPSMKEVVNALQQIEAIGGKLKERRMSSSRSKDDSYGKLQSPRQR